jgi:hypothetical protein
MKGEGTEREDSMTSVVLGLFALRHFARCAAVLEFAGRLKAQAYCPRPEWLAPESEE